MSKLRKCYCGYDVATFYQLRGMERLWFVSCPNPKCNIRTPYHHTEEKAVESWNNRTPDHVADTSEIVKLNAKLKALLKEAYAIFRNDELSDEDREDLTFHVITECRDIFPKDTAKYEDIGEWENE